jgi:hypothetical protein
VLYDDVMVFHLETAISNSSAKFSKENWNQFRLFSRYLSCFVSTEKGLFIARNKGEAANDIFSRAPDSFQGGQMSL